MGNLLLDLIIGPTIQYFPFIGQTVRIPKLWAFSSKEALLSPSKKNGWKTQKEVIENKPACCLLLQDVGLPKWWNWWVPSQQLILYLNSTLHLHFQSLKWAYHQTEYWMGLVCKEQKLHILQSTHQENEIEKISLLGSLSLSQAAWPVHDWLKNKDKNHHLNKASTQSRLWDHKDCIIFYEEHKFTRICTKVCPKSTTLNLHEENHTFLLC